VLEFYSVPPLPILPPMSAADCNPRVCVDASFERVRALRLLCALLAAGIVGGCAAPGTTPDTSRTEPAKAPETAPRAPAAKPGMPSNQEPPPPAVNLSGFPLAYRQGYADGCASANGGERKDATRFAADGNYRTGWADGLALCRRK
jgi:hypothetical protein